MKSSEIQKLRALSTEDINKEIAKLKEELFNLRFQLAVGQLENPARVSKVKKTIAIMKTIISERAN